MNGVDRRRRRSMRARFAVAALVFVMPPASAFGAGPGPARPNVVLLMSDDQGWGEIGYQGHSRIQTPALDGMARAGIRFDRFYAAAPICSPTRASVMTGRHPIRSGVLSRNYALRPEETTLAGILKGAGYRTAHFGKWHLGPVKADSPVNPRAFGFQGYLSADRAFNLDDVLSRNGATPLQYSGEGSEIIVEEALRFMLAAKEDRIPFFVVIWFGSPHRPYVSRAADRKRYGGGDDELTHRFAEISAMDRAIGWLRGSLAAMKADRETIVWFCSDNGPPENIRENAHLRGRKGELFEGGIRVPGILVWPGVIPRNKLVTTPASTSDILPTVLDLVRLEPPDRILDGVSLEPLIGDGDFARPPIGFWLYPTAAERQNPPWMDEAGLVGERHPRSPRNPARFYNFHHPNPKSDGFTGAAAWLEDDWKLLLPDPGAETGQKPSFELYDLATDPGERRDVASQHRDVVAKLEQGLRTWQRSVERSLSGADYAEGAKH